LDWVKIELLKDDLFNWKILIDGPPNTPYEGGVFEILLSIPFTYPFKAPVVEFKTKVYHPNVLQKDGKICAQILADKWNPAIKMNQVLGILRHMLEYPVVDAAIEEAVAKQLRDNKDDFEATAREWTKNYAAPTQATTDTIADIITDTV